MSSELKVLINVLCDQLKERKWNDDMDAREVVRRLKRILFNVENMERKIETLETDILYADIALDK